MYRDSRRIWEFLVHMYRDSRQSRDRDDGNKEECEEGRKVRRWKLKLLQLSLRLIGLWERGESAADVVGWKVEERGTTTAAAEMARWKGVGLRGAVAGAAVEVARARWMEVVVMAMRTEEVVTARLKGVVKMVSAVC